MEKTAHQPMAAARPVAPSQATGAAQRRRAQQKRSAARHVAWMTSLLQAEASHHSGNQLASAIASLQADVARLYQRLEKYEAVVYHTAKVLPGREPGTDLSANTDDCLQQPCPQPDPHLDKEASLVQVSRPTVNALVARFEGLSGQSAVVP